jgi:hypothetical protein
VTLETNGVSHLQIKLHHREGDEASRIRLEAIPLDEHIEGGHGEREPGVKRRPEPVHDVLAVTHDSQHRQDHLDEDAILPLATLTEFEVGGVAFRRHGRGGQEGLRPVLMGLEKAQEAGALGELGK